MSEQVRRRQRHLIDPSELGKPRPNRAEEKAKLERVQRWVISVLSVTTILHLAAGLVIAAWVMNANRAGARIGLLVLAAMFGMIAVAVGRAVHRKSPVSAWLLLGWIPAVVGFVLIHP